MFNIDSESSGESRIEFRFALYVFCMDYHSGQWSRLYRIMCRLRAKLPDSAIYAIQGNRHKKREYGISDDTWNEWEHSRGYYRQLKRSKYATDTK